MTRQTGTTIIVTARRTDIMTIAKAMGTSAATATMPRIASVTIARIDERTAVMIASIAGKRADTSDSTSVAGRASSRDRASDVAICPAVRTT